MSAISAPCRPTAPWRVRLELAHLQLQALAQNAAYVFRGLELFPLSAASAPSVSSPELGRGRHVGQPTSPVLLFKRAHVTRLKRVHFPFLLSCDQKAGLQQIHSHNHKKRLKLSN